MVTEKSTPGEVRGRGPAGTGKKEKAPGPSKTKKAPPAKEKTSTAAKRKARKRPANRSATGPEAAVASPVRGHAESDIPVVGVGASAGGLEAFTELLKHLPSDTGMAFVLIQHLDPQHKSCLAEILARSTEMPVAEITDAERLQSNHVYIIPPNKDLAVLHGVLHLLSRVEPTTRSMPIDGFLRSLAEDQDGRAIGIVLSGTGSDGALGLRAIKAANGIAFVQAPASAKYSGMPLAALEAGHVDFTLPPAGIAKELARIARHPNFARLQSRQPRVPLFDAPEALQKIFIILRRVCKVDFTHYKPSTVERRISRRMVLHKVESIDHYVKYLQETPDEVHALFEDMLINVTGFFRDPELFDVLKQKVFPRLAEEKPAETPIRVWVPGCSTGEEAYSIAIALLEFFGAQELQSPIQIFGTDISDAALETARAGHYAPNIVADVSPERLGRFFSGDESGYQISKTVRDACVFANQNVTKDPPFSHIDLLSCRNLLIYLGPVLQERTIPTFHFALKPTGFLVLGTAETIGGFSDLFSVSDRKYKIYTKKPTAPQLPIGLGLPDFTARPAAAAKKPSPVARTGTDLERQADRIVLAKYGPAGLVVNARMKILQFRGQVGRYLEPASGEATFNLSKMACPALSFELQAAILKAKKAGEPVRREGLRLDSSGRLLEVNVEVVPIDPAEAGERRFLILFDETPAAPLAEKKPAAAGKEADPAEPTEVVREAERLRYELASTKETLQMIVEEHESVNEEFRAANEEIQSSNEELQSTNEELETAKEELQSTNEELTTVNDELENRNIQLSQAMSDLHNLLNSVNVPVVMLDPDLRIRSFTPLAQRVLKLIPADAGRPIGELKLGIQVANLEAQIMDVIENLNTKEQEVQAADGCWYSMRIRPVRTADQRIVGAVLTLLDITAQKVALRDAQVLAEQIVATIREPLVILDARLHVVSANATFYKTFQVTAANTENRLLYDLGNRQWDIPCLRTLLEEIIPRHSQFEDFPVDHDFPGIGRKKMLLNARQIDRASGEPHLILLAIEEVTDDQDTGG